MSSEKIQITTDIILLMEKASRLEVTTSFEDKILKDRTKAAKTYSLKAVISEDQLGVIQDMADRFDEVMRIRIR